MQTAIVTGATRGIGKAIALKLTELHYNLVIVGRTAKLLDQIKSEIEKTGGRCLTVVADLGQENAPGHIMEKTVSHFGQMDVLVNNAGMSHSGPLLETDMETWDKVHAVNARAPFFLSKAAIPYLKVSPNPVIINIGSVVGFKGYRDQAAYASSKHALTGFTKVLAKEVQKDGIKVHLISPGGVNTEMVRENPVRRL